MSRRDGTGPMGMGPSTGRGMGLCSANRDVVNIRVMRLGLGLGRHFCRQGFGGLNYSSNRDLLMRQKTFLEDRLNWINKMLTSSKE